MPTLIERLKHFEEHQKEQGDKYGAEVLYRARRRIEELEERIDMRLIDEDVLSEFSDEDLQEELEKRDLEKRLQEKPQQIENPDLTLLRQACQRQVDDLFNEGWCDEDLDHYIYEAAMKAIFGDDIFDWVNRYWR